MKLWLILLTVAISSCARPPSAPEMTAHEWRAWTLPPDGASLPTPRSLAVGPNDELATLDTAGRVLIYDAEGKLQRQWKMLDVRAGKPEGIVLLNDGRVVVCDTHYHRVVWFDQSGNWLKNVGQYGRGVGEFIFPVGICKDPEENLYVCEYGGHDRVHKFTREGKPLLEFGSFGTGPAEFQRPSGLAWRDGKVYVTDAINNRVLIFTDMGKYLGVLGKPNESLPLGLPYDIALDADGTFLVIEYGAGRLSRLSADGEWLGRLGHAGTGTGEFATPWGLTIDSQRRVHVADTQNRRVVTLRL